MEPTTVFLIDDNATFRRIAVQFIETQPDIVVIGTAERGDQALELLPALKPDIALIDLAMPGLPGLETIPQLRALMPQLRIIALTVMDTPGFRQAALNAGADAFISKAALRTELILTIRRLMTARQRDLEVLETLARREAGASPRILVLADNLSLRSLYLKTLRKQAYEVYGAATPGEACDLLQHTRFDVFMGDVQSDAAQNANIVQQCRSASFAGGAQVVIMAGHAQARAECEALGVDFFLEKPIALTALVHLIDRVLTRYAPPGESSD